MGTPQTGFAEKMVSKSIIALKQRFDNNKPSSTYNILIHFNI